MSLEKFDESPDKGPNEVLYQAIASDCYFPLLQLCHEYLNSRRYLLTGIATYANIQ